MKLSKEMVLQSAAMFAGSLGVKVLAADNEPPLTATKPFVSISDVIDKGICVAIDWLFYGAIVFSVIYILLAAFGYVTSGGDIEKTKAAKSRILYAAIGVGVAIVAWGVPNIVASLFPGVTLGSFCTGE